MAGLRTPIALNLSPEMERGKYVLNEPDFNLLTELGGHWLEGRYGVGGNGRADMVTLARALGRINLLTLHDDDIIMCTRPNNQQANAYSYRVDTAVATLVGLTMGWAGSFRPIHNVRDQAAAFGWGLQVYVRDFEAREYRVITLSESLVGNLESAQMVQGKRWHAPLRVHTSAGSSNDFLFSP